MKIEKELPEGFSAEYEDGVLTIESDGESVEKKLEHSFIDAEVSGGKVVFSTDSKRRDIKSIVKTFSSHMENMIEGLKDGHKYVMKGVYAHFPMTIKQEDNKVLIENFMGERAPREVEIMEGVNVSINDEDLEITGSDKYKVSQTAARIEQACKKGNRDPRTFQDGVYVVEGGNNE